MLRLVYDWLLFLHVLAAFALVAALVIYTAITFAGWRVDTASSALSFFRVAKPALILVSAGSVLALVFGVWLVFEAPGDYKLWDAWIIAALVLWLIVVVAGSRTGREYTSARELATRLSTEGNDAPSPELNALLRTSRGLALHGVTVAAVLLLLLDMLFKPGT